MGKSENSNQQMEQQALEENIKHIRHKFVILSGKGGVGKSTVVVNLAYSLARQGKTVGILDTDLHGPNIAKMMGLEGAPMTASSAEEIVPLESHGIKVVSMASFLPDADSPVVWRGPLKMKAIQQFLSETRWGTLDYLLVDSPPGTGDEPLSVCQLIPDIDGVIVVTTPQEVALLDSRKSVNFARLLKVPVLGIVENMSGLSCPHCGKQIDLFKSGGGERAAQELKVPFLGRVPIDPQMVLSGDDGRPFVHDHGETAAARAMEEILSNVLRSVEGTSGSDNEKCEVQSEKCKVQSKK